MADRQLDLEARLEELNPDFDGDASEPSDKKYRPLVRDPSGRCLQQYLIATEASQPAQSSQFDPHYVAPSNIGGWASNLAEIQATAPYLAYEQLGAFLEPAKYADPPSPGAESLAVRVSRVLLRGHAHVSHLTRLIEFEYHRATPPVPGSRRRSKPSNIFCRGMVEVFVEGTILVLTPM